MIYENPIIFEKLVESDIKEKLYLLQKILLKGLFLAG